MFIIKNWDSIDEEKIIFIGLVFDLLEVRCWKVVFDNFQFVVLLIGKYYINFIGISCFINEDDICSMLNNIC